MDRCYRVNLVASMVAVVLLAVVPGVCQSENIWVGDRVGLEQVPGVWSFLGDVGILGAGGVVPYRIPGGLDQWRSSGMQNTGHVILDLVGGVEFGRIVRHDFAVPGVVSYISEPVDFTFRWGHWGIE